MGFQAQTSCRWTDPNTQGWISCSRISAKVWHRLWWRICTCGEIQLTFSSCNLQRALFEDLPNGCPDCLSELDEEIYMQQIYGFVSKDHPDMVCTLRKSLWIEASSSLLERNHLSNDADPCIYYKRVKIIDTERLVIVVVCVNDLLIATNLKWHSAVKMEKRKSWVKALIWKMKVKFTFVLVCQSSKTENKVCPESTKEHILQMC